MGKCQYVFAQDCSENKLFTVFTKNRACGRFGAACVDSVTVVLAGYKIQFHRVVRLAIINGVKFTSFPVVRPGKLNTDFFSNSGFFNCFTRVHQRRQRGSGFHTYCKRPTFLRLFDQFFKITLLKLHFWQYFCTVPVFLL